MLFSTNRLRKKKDFEAVLKNKQSQALAVSFLGVRFLENNLSKIRVGFVVSKKVSKKAVFRNKIKRQLREIVRPKIKNFQQGVDLIIFAKPEILGKDFAEIKKVVDIIFQKAGIGK